MMNVNFKIPLFIGMLMGINGVVSSQDTVNTDKEVKCVFDYKFTGEISPQLDSSYTVYAVIDKKDLKKVEKLKIKMNSSEINDVEIDLNKSDKVKKTLRKVYVDCGSTSDKYQIYSK